jgi:hypothetical protein
VGLALIRQPCPALSDHGMSLRDGTDTWDQSRGREPEQSIPPPPGARAEPGRAEDRGEVNYSVSLGDEGREPRRRSEVPTLTTLAAGPPFTGLVRGSRRDAPRRAASLGTRSTVPRRAVI